MPTMFADDLDLEPGFDLFEGTSLYEEKPVVVVEFSRNGYPLGTGEFYANGGYGIDGGILTDEGADLLSDLLDMGWTCGSVDSTDFKVSQ
jgi:hypothetical protein